MGLKDEFNKIIESAKDVVAGAGNVAEGAKDAVKPPQDSGLPGVATPDQTRTDGLIPDPGLSHADTAGLVEDRKRKGNLEGM